MRAIVKKLGDPDEIAYTRVDKITPNGIITDDSAGDEIDVILIPWHRVLEIGSNVEGELYEKAD